MYKVVAFIATGGSDETKLYNHPLTIVMLCHMSQNFWQMHLLIDFRQHICDKTNMMMLSFGNDFGQ